MIPLAKPYFDEREVAAVAEVIRTGWISQGPVVERFEQALAEWVGAAHGVATNSCTSAMQMTLELMGVTDGDEVICPSFTCMASANAVIQAGAMVRFVDVDAETCNMEPAAVEAAITPATKALMVVHQIGLPAALDALNAIATRHGLVVVEDAGCALGAAVNGKRIGASPNPVCFSFHPRKTLTTGEGGMLLTSDGDLAARARVYRSHGVAGNGIERHRAKGLLYGEAVSYGHNFRMTDIQAALGLVQLSKLDEMLAARAAVAARYTDRLAASSLIAVPGVPDGLTHAWQSYLVRLDASVDRDAVLRRLSDINIIGQRGIAPLHWEPYFNARVGELVLPVTEAIYRQSLFLPIYPSMSPDEVDRVVAALLEAVERTA